LPFTASHIIFALPFYKWLSKRLSLTGLVIGSMISDVEYYLRMTMYGVWGNTLKGIFLYELPLAIIISFVYHLIVRDVLIKHLPEPWHNKWSHLLGFDWSGYFKNNWGWYFISLTVGILTHLFWDILTHEAGYIFGIELQFLNQNVFHCNKL